MSTEDDVVDATLVTLTDLDAAPRRKVRPKPFVFVLPSDGTQIHFADPEDLDWQEVAAVSGSEDPRDFFMLTIRDDDELNAFFLEPLKGTQIGKLIDLYQKHYGVLQSRGNSRGSRRP